MSGGWPSHAWDQLKSLTVDELIRALEKDGWFLARSNGARRWYRHPSGRGVSIHYHARRTLSPKLLRQLLLTIGWTEADLRQLKLIK